MMLPNIAVVAFLWTVCVQAQRCLPAIQTDFKPQIFVMSDISNEPDDTMSFIRLFLHADQYNITGIAAVTSIWLNDSTYPDQILNTVKAYGQVVDNLNTHSEGTFPTEDYLASIVKSGPEAYGTAGIGREPLSSGSARLIDVVDGMADNDILHCTAWGGINMLAETLLHISRTRPQLEIDRFTRKLRIYAISDQDNAGPWIRGNFPLIPYIVSLHGFNQYGLATWTGISGDLLYTESNGGPNTSLVDQDYISRNFQIGPLGRLYPDIAYIMEGDSPSFMHAMMNGVNGGPYDHPEWGGWGGRYLPQDPSGQNHFFGDARDNVTGVDGSWHISNQATIWRWRQAYQDEMSARVQWSIRSTREEGSHTPVVSLNESCDSSPLMVSAKPGQEVVLDAMGSYDPDSNVTDRDSLVYNWFQYKEPSAEPQQNTISAVPTLNFTLSSDAKVARMRMPSVEDWCYDVTPSQQRLQGISTVCFQLHVILEVTGSGTPPIRRYKRAVLKLGQGNAIVDNERDEL